MVLKVSHRTAFITICLLLLKCFIANVSAQENTYLELRGTYTHQHYISKYRFWFRNDVGIRPNFGDDPFTMFLLRPRAIVELGNIVDLHPAVDFRFSYNQNAAYTFELRTWQGLTLHWPDVGRVMFDHFYRFEQRFHWTEGVKEEDIGLRSRYRLNMRVPLNNTSVIDNTFFTELRGEFFFPHGEDIQETFASTIRLGLIIGYHQNRKWRYQLTGYIESGENTIDDDRSVGRYIIEVTVRTMF